MAKNSFVTQQEVWNACDDFATQGRKDINAQSIQQYLGHGSTTTVQKFINTWRHENNDKVLVKEAPIPDVMQDVFKHNNREIWSRAYAEAEKMVTSERETRLTADIDLLRSNLKLANNEIEKLSILADERLDRLEECRNQIIEFAGEIARLKQLEDKYNKELTLAQEIVKIVGIENKEIFRQAINNPKVQQFIMELALKSSDANLLSQG